MEKGNKVFHKLDRLIGIPIVFILGLFKLKKKQVPLNISKIAILNLGSIGDNVLMSGPIADLRSKYPDAFICIFTGDSNYQMVKLIFGIDEIIKLPITRPFKCLKIFKAKEKFDIVFDFGPWPRLNAIYSNFIKGKVKVGFKSHKQYRHYVYDIPVKHRSDLHEIDNHRNLIAPLYASSPNHNPSINFKTSNKVNEIVDASGKYCIVHGWSGGLRSDLKQWSNVKWAELISLLSSHFDTILLTGAPSDLKKTDELLRCIDKIKMFCTITNVAGKLNLGETAYLIEKANYIICVDTGISHMAAALNKELICLQGPANSLRWRPYSERAIVINPDKGEYGYLNFGYESPKSDTNSMDNISVEMVYEKFVSATLT